MKNILLILLISLLTINCVIDEYPELKSSDKMVLYADYDEDKLFLLDLETLEKSSILNNISEQDHFLFWDRDKILRIQPQGTKAAYFVYDIPKRKWEGRNYKSSNNDVHITSGACNYNDSLLIIAGTENIYYETPYHDFYDTIKTGFGFLMGLKCSRNGILAVLYSDSEEVDFFNSQNLLFYNLHTQEKVNTDIKPFLLKEWSVDGKYLSLYDISDKENVNKKVEYPSLQLIDDSNSLFGYKYLNDSLMIYDVMEDTSDSMGPSNLYIYNLNSDSNVKLTNTSTRKLLFDVKYK